MKLKINLIILLVITFINCITAYNQVPDVEKVVVIGFDGADYHLTEKLMAEGKMPNFAKLKEQGVFTKMMPTNPPQTPVSFASFATSYNPGRTQIFDFLKRDVSKGKGSYYPQFAMMKEDAAPFLFGEKNPLYLGLTTAGFFLLLLIIGIIFSKRKLLVSFIFIILMIIGFIGAYLFSSNYIPKKIPVAVNNRLGKTFWRVAEEHGYRTKVLRVPTTYPAEELIEGEMLSGLGVPDMRGTIGQPSFYTDDASLLERENEFSVKIMVIDPEENPVKTEIIGPRNKFFYDPEQPEKMQEKKIPERFNIPLEIKIDWEKEIVTVSTQNQSANLKLLEWSDWFILDFKVNPIFHLKGMCRFYLVSLHPRLGLYLSPLHFHPSNERLRFSFPKDWAMILANKFGLFKTMGWAIDTWTITANLVGEEHFLQDMYFTANQYEKMMKELIKEGDYDLYVQIYEFTDRVQHIMWRLFDEGHPLYNKNKAEKHGKSIEEAYIKMDTIIGEAMSVLPPKTLLMVMSDHGFASFRRGINYNTWLVKNGFMTLKGQNEVKTLDDLFGQGDFFQNVDWSKTKAYAIGLGAIYINLKGREPEGIVNSGKEYDEVCDAIIKGLEEYVDPLTGMHPVYKVYKRNNIYHSFNDDLIPDLRVANNNYYRVSWQTTLGGVPKDIVEDNLKVWSADHCSIEPTIIPGIFLSNYKIKRENPSIMDIHPSVLQLLKIQPTADIDGKSFY